MVAKLDLEQHYRSALRLLRYVERDMPGLLARIPKQCPYSLDQIIGAGDEDWFPAARSPAP